MTQLPEQSVKIRNKAQHIFSLAVTGLVGLFFLALAILQLVTGGYIFCLLDIIAGALAFPLARERLLGRFEARLSDTVLVRTIGALFVISLIGLTFNYDARLAEEAQQQKELAAAAKAESQALLNQHFANNRATILSTVSRALDNGQLEQASLELRKYTLADADLLKLTKRLKVLQLQKSLKNPNLSLDEQAAAYKSLSALMPEDAKVAASAKKLATEVETQNKLAAEKANRARELKAQFSSVDGSHFNVEAAIKDRMNDPDSYVHVRTRYVDTKNGLIVFTTFRGANAFRGIITKTVMARVDRSGNVISLDF